MSGERLQRLDQIEAALARDGLDPEPYGPVLDRVRRYLRRYAELEHWLLGRIQIPVPRHLLEAGTPESDPPPDPVETLARRERVRLGLAGAGDRDVMARLDRGGLKIYRPPFPPGGKLRGFTLFDEAVGPAFVADGRLPAPAANAVFARLYGHYLLDHDPYEILTVAVGDAANAPRALRGEHFAVALLIGARELGTYLEASGWRAGHPVEPPLLDQLAVYFEVGRETVLRRLLSLGLIEAASISESAPSGRTLPETGSPEVPAVPERFVRLALEAHARGLLGLKALARDLETDLASARRLSGQFEPGALDSGAGDG